MKLKLLIAAAAVALCPSLGAQVLAPATWLLSKREVVWP